MPRFGGDFFCVFDTCTRNGYAADMTDINEFRQRKAQRKEQQQSTLAKDKAEAIKGLRDAAGYLNDLVLQVQSGMHTETALDVMGQLAHYLKPYEEFLESELMHTGPDE